MLWLFPIAIIELLGGSALFGLSLTRRWVNWCADKPFAIPFFVLAAGYWGIALSLTHFVKLLELLSHNAR
jgi:hypothetical protein